MWVLDFLLGVEVRTVGFVNPVLRTAFHIGKERVGRSGTDGGEFRILFNLHAPALVVAQVPVKAVHFVVSHDIEHAFHLVGCEEVARNVEHEAAVFKARFVADLHLRQHIFRHLCILYACHDVGRQNFLDRLQGVEQSFGRFGLYGYAVVFGQKVVAIGLHVRIFRHSDLEHGLFVGFDSLCLVARGLVECRHKAFHLVLHIGREVGAVAHLHIGGQHHITRHHRHAFSLGC